MSKLFQDAKDKSGLSLREIGRRMDNGKGGTMSKFVVKRCIDNPGDSLVETVIKCAAVLGIPERKAVDEWLRDRKERKNLS